MALYEILAMMKNWNASKARVCHEPSGAVLEYTSEFVEGVTARPSPSPVALLSEPCTDDAERLLIGLGANARMHGCLRAFIPDPHTAIPTGEVFHYVRLTIEGLDTLVILAELSHAPESDPGRHADSEPRP